MRLRRSWRLVLLSWAKLLLLWKVPLARRLASRPSSWLCLNSSRQLREAVRPSWRFSNWVLTFPLNR